MMIRTALHEHLSRFGYTRIETPIVENAALFLTKAGDQVIERLLTFSRSGKEYALRPEFTASAVERYQTLSGGAVRWQFSGEIFQDATSHPGRFQAMSLGAEFIGVSGTAADAEVIAAAALGLEHVGIQNYRVVIGHVGLTRHLLERFNLDDRTIRFLLNQKGALALGHKTDVIEKLDAYLIPNGTRLEMSVSENDSSQAEQVLVALLNSSERGITMGNRTREDIARRLVSKSQRAAQRESILAAVDWLAAWAQIESPVDVVQSVLAPYCADDTQARQLLDELLYTLTLLKAYGIDPARVRIKPDLARTWDYYTGIVFELTTPEGIDLGGGGRYDELTRLLGGKTTPAVGFAYYLDNLTPLVEQDATQEPCTLVLNATQDTLMAVQWAQALRFNGVHVALALEPNGQTPTVYIDAHQNLVYRDTTYTLEQVALLVARLGDA